MDTGDVVKHRPTGETWTVAFVDGDYLSWCGWPEGYAKVADCELVETAHPDARERLLYDLAKMDGVDSRKTYARKRLEEAEQVLPKEY